MCAGPTGLASAKLNTYAGAEGANGTISCYLSRSGSRKFFCKDECEAEDLLIKTDGDADRNGRFSLQHKSEFSGKEVVSVTISHLNRSDSGRFRCGFGNGPVPDSYIDFKIMVVDGEYLKAIKADIFTDNVQMNFRANIWLDGGGGPP